MIMYYAGIMYLLVKTLEMARKLSKSWEGADLWPDWVSGGGNSGPGADSIGNILPGFCVTLNAVLYFLYCNEMWNQLDGPDRVAGARRAT